MSPGPDTHADGSLPSPRPLRLEVEHGSARDRGGPELVACLTAPPGPDDDLRCHWPRAGWLQVRADRVGDLPAAWLREQFPGRLIYALPGSEAPDPRRDDRLRTAAAAGYDLVELEAERDLRPGLLAAIQPAQRLISWHGPAAGAAPLADRLRRLSAVAARFYRLVVVARYAQDALPPLELLRAAGRRDVVAFAAGEPGLWGRVLSAWMGAPLVFGTLGPDAAVSGEPSLARLVADFGLPGLPSVDRVFGIIGEQVGHSLSPRLHNAAYRALGVSALFLPFPVTTLAEFWRALVADGGLEERLGLSLGGLTVASPHKQDVPGLAAAVSRAARHAGSANLIYRRRAAWAAATTDPAGVLVPLAERGIAPAGRRAVVVGCGGSGRAIAAALHTAGARVVLSNRGRPRGEQAASRLGLPLVPLAALAAADFDLVVNATSVGREDEPLPFAVDRLAAGAVVVDLVYTRGATPLAEAARARGAVVVEGRQVLLAQVTRQFARMTGRDMPPDLAAGLLGLDGPTVAGRGVGADPGPPASAPPHPPAVEPFGFGETDAVYPGPWTMGPPR